jgi:pectinesterase
MPPSAACRTRCCGAGIYAEDCTIAGNVDFVWGTGTAYFARCEIATKGRRGYVVQARNPADAYGYVFVDSRFTSGDRP